MENIDSPAASVCTNTVCADCDDNVAVYADVSNMQQARAVLMGEPYMVPLSELQTKAAVRNKADEGGVSFPGWL